MLYQGESFKRTVRLTTVVAILAMTVKFILTSPSDAAGGFTTLAFLGLLAEVAFTRRMGITAGPDGLTLHYAVRRQTLAWDTVRGFQWDRWRRTTALWALTADGSRVRLPTVERSRGALGGLRGPEGVEADADRTLTSIAQRAGAAPVAVAPDPAKAHLRMQQLLRRLRTFIPVSFVLYPALWYARGPGSPDAHPLSGTVVIVLATMFVASTIASERYMTHLARRASDARH